MDMQTWLPVVISLTCTAFGLVPVPLGFPSLWNGDHYHQAECQVIQKPPSWVDGFLFAQTYGSYGDRSNPKGAKIMHMFDAAAAVSVYEVSPSKATFTGAYYPNRANKIWNFEDRDFTKSKVAWYTMFTDINATALEIWKTIPTDPGVDISPSIDFWKIGTTVVAGTETFNPMGMSVDVPNVENIKPFFFKETDDRILKRQLIGIHTPMHEHVEQGTGLIWDAAIAINISNTPPTFHELVFTIDDKGTRTTQGIFDFSPIDYSKCSKDNGTYGGPVSGGGIVFPRYMHTITATENYLILPMSSVTLRACGIVFPQPPNPDNLTVFTPRSYPFDFDQSAPVVFLFFDKKAKKFLEPIEYKAPIFFTHRFNSYETSDGKVIVDMLGYDRDVYGMLTTDNLLSHDDHPEMTTQVTRFTIDTKAKTVATRSLVPQNDQAKFEFSQINRNFEAKPYKYGYAVQFPFFLGNQVVKIDMETPDGSKNKIFQPSDTVSLAEPYFVARPGSTEEDDGVLVIRGLDTSVNKSRIYVVDPKSMQRVGEVLSPTYTPFGLHERFYTKEQLGMTQTSGASRSRGNWFWS